MVLRTERVDYGLDVERRAGRRAVNAGVHADELHMGDCERVVGEEAPDSDARAETPCGEYGVGAGPVGDYYLAQHGAIEGHNSK